MNENTESIPEQTTVAIEEEPTPAKKYIEQIRVAMSKSAPIMDYTGMNPLRVEHFPADVKDIIIAVCQNWKLRPPSKSTRRGGEFSRWIGDARELVDACGEFGTAAVVGCRADFVEYMDKHGGNPPFTVSGPGSLIKSVRAVAARMRDKKQTGPLQSDIVDGGFYA